MSFAVGTTVGLELEWDSNSGTQVDFIARVDTSTLDFSALSDVITVTDSTAPFLTATSEGLCGRYNSSSNDATFDFDQTKIVSLPAI